MKLTDGRDAEFELIVAGYQFPHLEDEPFDADWLNIQVNVKHARGAWSKTDPCLLTWEVAALAGWLEGLAENNPPHSAKNFMEPELAFEWLGKGRNTLRVYLHYSMRPSWSPYHGPNEEKDLFVEFTVPPEALRKAAASLLSEVKEFPVKVRV